MIGVAALALPIGLGALLVLTYPIWLDPQPLKSVWLRSVARSGQVMPAREAFGDSELYCSIGPYDSLDHARFDGQLNDKARNALRQALAKTTGQERVVIVGITHDAVDFVYRTYLFEHPKTARATISFADCVGGDGVLRFDRHKDLILLRLATR